MEKWNKRINAIMVCSVSLAISRFIMDYVDLIYLRPEEYAMRSAPWYVGGFVYGAITFVILLVCVVIKAIIRFRSNKAASLRSACAGDQESGM